MSSGTPPVTGEEHAAALRVFHAAPESMTKGELRRMISEAVRGIRDRSGPYSVHADSFDMPGPGPVISTHPNEAEALTECIRLNQAYDGDAGSYTIRPAAVVGR
jgi:hypothetical protein